MLTYQNELLGDVCTIYFSRVILSEVSVINEGKQSPILLIIDTEDQRVVRMVHLIQLVAPQTP